MGTIGTDINVGRIEVHGHDREHGGYGSEAAGAGAELQNAAIGRDVAVEEIEKLVVPQDPIS